MSDFDPDAVISKFKTVGITYSIMDEAGVVLEQSDVPVYYVHGGPNSMFPEVEGVLDGCSTGDSIEVILQPDRAFGYHDPTMTFTDDIENVPPEFRHVGAEVQMQNDQGETRNFYVSSIDGDRLTVDGNHPFAGKTLTYALTVVDIRDATEEEKQNGASAPVIH